MGQTTPFPEPDSPSLEPYLVYSRVEIVAVLRQLLAAGALVTAYYDRDAGFAVTAMLTVKPEFEEVVFDNPSDAHALRRLLAADKVTFVAFLDQVKVQFTARAIEPIQFQGHGAFRVRVPDQLLRLQRRDGFRVRTPVSKAPTCAVPHGEDVQQVEKLRVLDISIGGLALLSYPAKLDLTDCEFIEQCVLDLPGVGSVAVMLKIHHIDAMPRDEKARRLSCEFVSLAPQARHLVQRYVNLVDAESRKFTSRVA